jgi:hypothetical protein
MFNLYFLSAYAPLTKTFSLDKDNNLTKSPYPNVRDFTSHAEQCTTLLDMYNAVQKHSKLGHCMVKGKLNSDLNNEPRKGSTNTIDSTNFILLDLDDAPWKTHEEFMAAYPALKDASYFVQHSSSYGFSNKKGLSCHIFIMLDAFVSAVSIKPWLMSLNLKNGTAFSAITLSNAASSLHWPVDITTCQNDKLIFIAPPILGRGVVSKIKDTDRMAFIAKKEKAMSHTVFAEHTLGALRLEATKKINELREKAGYEALSKSTKWVGDSEVQVKAGLMDITGIRASGDFVHLNLNGGDSWAYYHTVDSFEIIKNFKGELDLFTKEINPAYYRECIQARSARDEEEQTQAPVANEEGDILLAFRDLPTDKYFNGTWNDVNHELALYKAGDVQKLRDFLAHHGARDFGEHVPIWKMHFTPTSNVVYDPENKTLNTFVPSPYLRAQYKAPKGKIGIAWPTIYKVIRSAVCGPDATPSEEVEALFEHLLNWIAVICQYRVKAESAWLFSGIEGTGKSMLVDHILAPILGRKYALSKPAASLEDSFTAWIPTALLVFIDEIDIKSSAKSRNIVDRLKNMITAHITDARAMHTDAAQVENHLNFIFSSNRVDPIELTETDRRYNIGIFQTKKLEMTDHEVDVLIPAELKHFAQYIMTRKADKNQAKKVLDSSTRRDIIGNSRTSLDEIGLCLTEGNLAKLNENCQDLNLINELHGADTTSATASAFMNIIKREVMFIHEHRNEPPPYSRRYMVGQPQKGWVRVPSRLTRDELYVVFQHCVGNMPTTPAKFSKLLGHKNLHVVPIKTNNKDTARGIYVTWEIHKDVLAQLVEQHTPKLSVVSAIKKSKAPI